MLMTAQYRWVGHVTRMDDARLPKIIFYSEFEHGTRSRGGQLKRYTDMLKMNMRVCDMQPKELEHITSDRSSWRTLFKEQVSVFERRVYSHFKTSVFNARLAVNCRRTAASPATSAAVSVQQGSDLSPTNEFICDPEIRRVDGSVQQSNSL